MNPFSKWFRSQQPATYALPTFPKYPNNYFKWTRPKTPAPTVQKSIPTYVQQSIPTYVQHTEDPHVQSANPYAQTIGEEYWRQFHYDDLQAMAGQAPLTEKELAEKLRSKIAEYSQKISKIENLIGTFENESRLKTHLIDQIDKFIEMNLQEYIARGCCPVDGREIVDHVIEKVVMDLNDDWSPAFEQEAESLLAEAERKKVRE